MIEWLFQKARFYYRFPEEVDNPGMILAKDPAESGLISVAASYISIGNLPPGQWKTGYEPGTRNVGLEAPNDKLDTVAEMLQKYGHREQPVAGKLRPILTPNFI